MLDLHEPHAALDETARREELHAEITGFGPLEAVKPAGRLALGGEVEDVRKRSLHAEGEFVGLDASGQLRVGYPLLAAEQRNAPAMARQGLVAEQEFGGVQAASGTSGSLRPSLSTASLARAM